MTQISAKIIADSISPSKHRITTMIVVFPRFLLSEFNTHRMFSRNSASSRAIPFKKMIESIEKNPFIPIAWQKDHSGMQGTEYLPESDAFHCREAHLVARDHAVYQATLQNERYGVTKQICNRYLEPFMWHTVIVTSTEWENFFALRCPQYILEVQDPGTIYRSRKDLLEAHAQYKLNTELEWLRTNKGQAEIHMMALAEAMWDAMNESVPVELKAGEWHIPFGDQIDDHLLASYLKVFGKVDNPAFTVITSVKGGLIMHDALADEVGGLTSTKLRIKIATACCARVSYTVVGEEGKEPNYENDIKLHDRLLASGHLSPFEHCAKVPTDNEWESLQRRTEGFSANFFGFIQYRKMIPNENRI